MHNMPSGLGKIEASNVMKCGNPTTIECCYFHYNCRTYNFIKRINYNENRMLLMAVANLSMLC
jgi:hypothetical protein